MKLCATLALFVIVGFVASSHALPARKRMVYYQQPTAAEWYGAAPQQRIMYMQYVQPGSNHARSAQAASTLVAGETVVSGTYVKDCDHAESEVAAAGPSSDDINAESQQGVDVLGAAGAHGASSVAEAYPDEAPVVQIAIDESSYTGEAAVSDDDAKVPREYNFAAEQPAAPAAEEPASVAEPEAELPPPAPIAPVAAVLPANRYLPAKKKVIVELDPTTAEDGEAPVAAFAEDEENENTVADDVEEDEEEYEVPVKPVAPRRPAPKKPVKAAAPAGRPTKKPSNKPAPLPAGTFFPIDFGGTNGGAIAIANSFSTGEGGSATSHAIAYGSPDAARARVRPNPNKLRH